MASRLICSLILCLALGMASTYIIEDSYQDKTTMEDMERAQLEKLASNMHKQANKDTTHLAKEEELHLHEDIQEDAHSFLEEVAKNLTIECNATLVKKISHAKEKLEACKKYYQAYQHGDKSIASDEKLNEALKSEKCSACVLEKLCARRDVRDELRIDASLSERRQERICKRRVLRMGIQVEEEEVRNIICDPNARFRTIDGTCNNLRNPLWGAAGTEFIRLVQPDFGDCISSLRLASSGNPLPNARNVSLLVHGRDSGSNRPDSPLLSYLAMNWGQFMDHDLSLAEAQGINCEEEEENEECINIHIPEADEAFRSRDIDFIELERDAPSDPASNCQLHVREVDNTITSPVDASNVYGSKDELANSIRAPGGLMKTMKHPMGCPLKDLLPPQPPEIFCPSKDPNRQCFLSGDERNNENQGLNSVHTLFVRHHNRIAKYFGQMTKWSGERIYQETRKIVGAQLQVITYGEFLTLILSEETRERFGLKLLKGTEYFNGYNKRVNSQISNAFSVAGYRFGHSLVRNQFDRLSQSSFEHKCNQCHGKETTFLPIPVLDFGNPQYLYDKGNGGVDSITRGLLKTPASKVDGFFSSSVQENLARGEGDIADLVAINIKRGHDRGVASYTTFRRLCNLTAIRSFEDLITVAGMPEEVVENMKLQYESVHDVDLFVGGMLEERDPRGGVLGPTFQCILSEQFRRTKIGDRFWHENAPNAAMNTDRTAFTPCQLREIRKTLLSRIICDNSDEITAVQRRALEQSDIKVPCNKLPKVNYEPWLPNYQCDISADEGNAEW